MKPILFNTESVKAILDGRKSVTRRVVKLKYSNTHLEMRTDKYGTRLVEMQNEEPGITVIQKPDGGTTRHILAVEDKVPPYRPGCILYVREAWQQNYDSSYAYRAGHKFEKEGGWRPSIHMPKEAARLFLRVTDVRVERLQNITPEQLRAEGVKIFLLPSECQRMFNRFGAVGDFLEKKKEFAGLWDSAIKKDDLPRYGWEANPWTWVIEFERISKEEAFANDDRRSHSNNRGCKSGGRMELSFGICRSV